MKTVHNLFEIWLLSQIIFLHVEFVKIMKKIENNYLAI